MSKELSEDAKQWCVYIAGLIATYLGLNENKTVAIAGIIERRLWRLDAPLPVIEPVAWEADYEACKCPDNPSRCFSDRVFSMMRKYAHAVSAIAQDLRKEFPLLDETGLDQKLHHCEWSIQQERKRLHELLDELPVEQTPHATQQVTKPRTHVDDAAQKLDKLLGQVINRRVMVEQKLFDMAAGKLPMPDEKGLRKLAMELGDPAHNPPAVAGFSDAYNGAREDLAIWKKRALEAEELNRKFIAQVNDETFMGEPTPLAQLCDAQEEPDLLDLKLPIAVRVGGGIFGKGVSLRTVANQLKRIQDTYDDDLKARMSKQSICRENETEPPAAAINEQLLEALKMLKANPSSALWHNVANAAIAAAEKARGRG